MSTKRFSLVTILVTSLAIWVGFTGPAQAADVTLRIVDQHGVELPANYYPQVSVANVGTVPSGGTLSITPGTYAMSLWLYGNLCRDLNGANSVTIEATTTALDFEWITETFEVTLVDQHQAVLPSNWAPSIIVAGFGLPGVPPGGSFTLPITDNSVYPDIRPSSGFANGYLFDLAMFGNMARREVHEITQATDALTFEWITATMTVNLDDQSGTPLPAAWNPVISLPGGQYFAPGGMTTLPITDNAVYPTLRQAYASGFPFTLVLFSGNLARKEVVEILAATTVVEFEWITAAGPLHVVDAADTPVPGATWEFPGGLSPVSQNGAWMELPVTDNEAYPSLRLNYANGFFARLDPPTASSGVFQFEVLPDAVFDPSFVTIDGLQFGLRYIFNEPPVADAGDNLAILSADQSTTTLAGSATDPDLDPMTYQWFEGTTALASGDVLDGAAPLDLSLLPALTLGNHTFRLEISDGQATSVDEVILTVENSPPDLAVGGSIIAEIGADIALVGEASDFDGDDLTYEWTEDATVLASGSFATITGGDSVDVPSHLLVGGLSLGAHLLTLTVDDGFNDPVSATVSVNVIDTQAPTLAPVADVALLWPPNHQLVTVTVSLDSSDNGGGPLTFSALVASTENPDKDGDGNTIPDWTQPVFDEASDTMTLALRAERSGKGTGRVYTITITATDASDNSSESTVQIVCPHDRRKK